jgi:hypothetical protein
MAINCPQGSICSAPSVSYIQGKPYYTFTSTKVKQDSSGKINGGETTLYYSPNPNDYVPAAKTQNGGKSWEYLKYESGQNIPGGKKSGDEVFGIGAKKSLEQGALKTTTNSSIQTATKQAGVPPEQSKSLQLNQKTTNPSTNDQSKPTIDISSTLKVVDGTNSGLPGAGAAPLKYPTDMNARQDHILFTQIEYSPRALTDTTTNSEGNPLQLGKRSDNRTILGKVILPIQSGIMDGNNVRWAEDSLNALQLFQINVMRSAITGGFKAAAETTGAAAEEFKSDFSTEKGSIANLITQAVTQKNVLARTEGSIVNDNLELLFQSPSLRNFSFTFKLSAREASEAKMIANIIRFFKQGMAPKRTPNAYFLKSPNTFLLEYRHDNKDHPGMNKIKECALTNCSVNYTPDGYYAAHTDGYLVTYDVTMQFQELEPVYNDEYANLNNQIGY